MTINTTAAVAGTVGGDGRLPLEELVRRMTGRRSTGGWDAICSYSTTRLNALLASQYYAGRLPNRVTLETTTVDWTGTESPVTIQLLFAAPSIAFAPGQSGCAILRIPIEEGSTYTSRAHGTPDRTTPIPGGQYIVEAIVPLAVVSGNEKVSKEGDVVVFSASSAETHTIVLHFANQKSAVFRISPVTSSPQPDELSILLVPPLTNYFQTKVHELDYALASVSSHTVSQGNVSMTPSSFVFRSTGSDSDGVLSLYIQVSESKREPGEPCPVFRPDGKERSPIPRGYSASLIFSRDLVAAYLGKQLQDKGLTAAFMETEGEIRATLTAPIAIVVNDKASGSAYAFEEYTGLSATLDKFPLTLSIRDRTMTLAWSASLSSSWRFQSAPGSMADTGESTYGEVDIDLTLNKKGMIAPPTNTTLVLGKIEVLPADIKVKPKPRPCSFFASIFSGCREIVPPFYSKMKFSIPRELDLRLPVLDFFATTNLLSPGRDVVSVDAEEGMKTPYDVLLVGQVVAKETPA